MLDIKKCLLLIRGFHPIVDEKFDTFGLPEFKQTMDGGGMPYIHQKEPTKGIELLNENASSYLSEKSRRKEQVSVLEFDWQEFLAISEEKEEKENKQ